MYDWVSVKEDARKKIDIPSSRRVYFPSLLKLVPTTPDQGALFVDGREIEDEHTYLLNCQLHSTFIQ